MRLRTNAKLQNFMEHQSKKIEQTIQDMNEFRLNTMRMEIREHSGRQNA